MASSPVVLFTSLFIISALYLSIAAQNIQDEGNELSAEVVPVEFVIKRASNLGSRLMCRLDSRNCGAFNMGKKFGGYSWLRSADSTQRRLEYYLANKWQRDDEMERLPSLQEDKFWPYRN